jgi:hypothetical protein
MQPQVSSHESHDTSKHTTPIFEPLRISKRQAHNLFGLGQRHYHRQWHPLPAQDCARSTQKHQDGPGSWLPQQEPLHAVLPAGHDLQVPPPAVTCLASASPCTATPHCGVAVQHAVPLAGWGLQPGAWRYVYSVWLHVWHVVAGVACNSCCLLVCVAVGRPVCVSTGTVNRLRLCSLHTEDSAHPASQRPDSGWLCSLVGTTLMHKDLQPCWAYADAQISLQQFGYKHTK